MIHFNNEFRVKVTKWFFIVGPNDITFWRNILILMKYTMFCIVCYLFIISCFTIDQILGLHLQSRLMEDVICPVHVIDVYMFHVTSA